MAAVDGGLSALNDTSALCAFEKISLRNVSAGFGRLATLAFGSGVTGGREQPPAITKVMIASRHSRSSDGGSGLRSSELVCNDNCIRNEATEVSGVS